MALLKIKVFFFFAFCPVDQYKITDVLSSALLGLLDFQVLRSFKLLLNVYQPTSGKFPDNLNPQIN